MFYIWRNISCCTLNRKLQEWEDQIELDVVKKRKYLFLLVFSHVLFVCRGGGEVYGLQLSVL